MLDEDSEAEKLSPLLQKTESSARTSGLALNMVDVVEPIDDADTDHEEMAHIQVPDKSKSGKRVFGLSTWHKSTKKLTFTRFVLYL